MTDLEKSQKPKSKPWHTKEWKEMRALRIGDKCEQCDSTDPPMLLQHLSHEEPESPPSKRDIVWDLMREFDQVPPRPTVRRPTCPECNDRSLGKRKKLKPTWRCNRCHNEFDEPRMVDTIINNRTEKDAWVKWKNEVLFPTHDDFADAHQDEVEQRFGTLIDEYELKRQASYDRYVSGEGTVTFCKKCAFLWDMKEMRLCGQCRKNYHPFRYDTCFSCLPESRKDEITKANIQWQAVMGEREAFLGQIDEWYEKSVTDSPDMEA